MSKITKIEAAINDTKSRLKKAEREVMLALKEKEVLQQQLDTLEIIRDGEQYE